MAADLLLFFPLAILSNTAFPLPFDHVLLWFAGGHGFRQASMFAAFGSGCAGVAALVDVALIGSLGRRWSVRHGSAPMRPAGRGFYGAVFLVALLPIPFTTIRLTLLRIRPSPLLYALIVSLARLPRYLVLIAFWHTLALPGWVGAVLVLSTVAWIVWQPRHDRLTKLSFVRRVVHISTSTVMLHSIREARLRSEYAPLYPDLTPGVWVPACNLRDFILERGLYQRRTGPPSHRRMLLESHFEFRGGTLARHSTWTGPHERSDEVTGS